MTARDRIPWAKPHFWGNEEWSELAGRCGFDVVESFSYAPAHICFINDLLVPLSAPGLLIKKIFNRWTLLPVLRRVWIYPVHLAAREVLRQGSFAEDGGLVFLSLEKVS